MTTPIPPELIEKVDGVAVLGPNDRLVLALDRDVTRMEFDRIVDAIPEDFRGRVMVVGGVDRVAVLRG